MNENADLSKPSMSDNDPSPLQNVPAGASSSAQEAGHGPHWMSSAVTGPTIAIVSCRSLEAPEVHLWLQTLGKQSSLVWILVPEESGSQAELPETLLSAVPRELRILRDGSLARAGDLWVLPVGERAAWNGQRFRWQLPLRGPETPSPFETLFESLSASQDTARSVTPIRLEAEHAKIGADGEARTVLLADLTRELERGLSAQSPFKATPTFEPSLEGPWAIVSREGRVLSASSEAQWLTTLDGAQARLHADLDAPLCNAIRTLQAGGLTVHVPERPVQAGDRNRPIGFVLAESDETPVGEPRFRVSFHSSLPWETGSGPATNTRSSELESFYDSAPVGLAAIDSEFRYLRINDRLAAMNGLPAHEHIGKTIHEVLGASGRSVEETMRPVLENGVAIRDLETRGKTRVDEDVRDWLLQYTPINDESGRVAGVNVVVQDITAQKEASRRLAAEHAITHLLADEISSTDLFPEILETLCQTFEIEMGEVWLYDENTERIEPTHTFSMSQDQASQAFQEATPEGYAERKGCPGQRAWLSRKTKVFRSLDLDTDFPRRELASACGIQLAMAFPMQGEGLPYGSIALYGERAFVDEAALHDSLETIGRDIGRFMRRERIEQALRQSEKELRILTDSIPMKISFVDAEGRYQFTNQEYVRSFGFTKEELQGRHVRDVVGEETYEHVKPMMQRALSGALVEYEIDVDEEKGPPATLAVKYKPREEPDGSISGFYALVVDVTQRANAERESMHKANCLEEIRRVNLELTGELDLARLERSVTEAAVKISGAEAGAFVHRITDESRLRAAVYSTVAEPPSRELKSSQAEYALQGPTLGATTSVRIADLREKPEFAGSLRLFAFPIDTAPIKSYLAAPVLDRHGALVGSIILTHSSTDAFTRNAEEIVGGIALQVGIALENASLYETLRAREQSSRFQARQLEIMDRRKDEFLAILGHELRNPLMALNVGMQVLRNEKTEPSEVEWTHQMLERQTAQLTSLIDDLLDATRISRGKVRLRKDSVDLIDVVEASVTTVEVLARAKAQSIQIVATGGDMRVFGDRVRLEQMATNLLNNAVKYSDQETSIRIILEQLSRKRVRLSVADQGMGLPKESLERIFEPFTQRDVSSDGLGIGLSLVRQLASLHGGRVYAESPGPGLGSTFSIELPTEDFADREEAAEPGTELNAENPPTDTDVLLINGSGIVDGETAEALRGHGCRILAARETDFEAKAEDLRPQIVIITVKDLEGESDLLANKIRKLPSCHGATVIALRQAFQSQDPKRALERVAFDEIWTEPVPEESMIEAVNRCVSQKARAHHNETLLLVEDNEDSARGMCLLLREDESRHVVSASTVADALKAFEKYRPQVVLSDIGLPDGSGYDLAKQLRSHGDSRLLLIAISGHAGDVDRRRSLDAGFDEHLAKPVDFNKLRELLKGRVH